MSREVQSRSRRRPWTREEVDFIVDSHTKLSKEAIAEKLDRSVGSVHKKLADTKNDYATRGNPLIFQALINVLETTNGGLTRREILTQINESNLLDFKLTRTTAHTYLDKLERQGRVRKRSEKRTRCRGHPHTIWELVKK